MTHRMLHARLVFVGGMLCILYVIIWIRVLSIQILSSHFFDELADRQYMTSMTYAPERAPIFDRHGTFLASNRDYMSAFVVPRSIKKVDDLIARLAKKFPGVEKRIQAHRDASFCFIKRRLSDEELAWLQSEHIPEVQYLREPGRYYPVTSAGIIVGVTDIDNHGITGLELLYDAQLRGTPRRYALKRDARSADTFFFERELAASGSAGVPITTTIDADLQFMAYQAVRESVAQFEATNGAALIVDSVTGDILALVQYPDFDPNHLASAEEGSMHPWPVTHTYEFGSVIKIFLTLAAIAEDVVSLDTMIDCKNSKSAVIQGIHVNTSFAAGIIPFKDVIARSNNIGTTQVALLLGTKLYDHYRLCGFGSCTGLGWPGEQSGCITHPSTWSRQSLASLSFGYEIRATLLQLACAFGIIVRDGVPLRPKIISGVGSECGDGVARYSKNVTQCVHGILEHVITHGAARCKALEGYHVCGKTGSAFLITDGKYDHSKNIFTFVGHIKKGSYERIIVTCIREPASSKLFASQTAAPLFEKIAEQMVIHEVVMKQAYHAPA